MSSTHKTENEISPANNDEDDIDAYMASDDILDYMPKPDELIEDDALKISDDAGLEHDRFQLELPKFQPKQNPANGAAHLNLDSTMTTDHTTDIHEQEFDEDELYIIESMEVADNKQHPNNQEHEYEEGYEEGGEEEEEDRPPRALRRSNSPSEQNNPRNSSTPKIPNENRSSASSQTSKQRLYQHPVSKPQFTAGKRQLSIAEARLFGLLNENGELTDLRSNEKSMTPEEKLQWKKYHHEMSLPKTIKEVDEQELRQSEGCTFKPTKSPEAIQAMKNPRCGYDFMQRINTRGSFADRVHELSSTKGGSKDGKLSKTEYEVMQKNYDALHTKLQCPKCLKPQSFDEFINKKRICTLCSLKFQKLNITSGQSFLKKNQEYEKKRREKLLEVEKDMYGDIPPKPTNSSATVSTAVKKVSRTSLSPEQVRPPALPERGDEAVLPDSKSRIGESGTQKPRSDQNVRALLAKLPSTTLNQGMKEEKFNQKEALEKIKTLNSTKNKQAVEAFEQVQQQQQQPLLSSENGAVKRPLSATVASTTLPPIGKNKQKMSQKMERLLST